MLVGLLMAMAMGSCSHKETAGVKAPVSVKTEVVGSTNKATAQTYVGIVEEREATAVSFTSMGTVKRMLVSEGQHVSRGQLIAEIDDTQARSVLDGAEAQMAQANDALERYKLLHDNGSLPEVQWVEIQSKVAQAKAQLGVARKNLSDCRLLAPVSGVVGRKQLKAGETALPSQAVVTILDISSVKIKVAVPETEISAIGPSTSSQVFVEAVGKRVNGGRIEKGVQADALTHTYDIRINVDNADRQLLPGMVANVTFGAAAGEQPAEQLTLPVTSVQKRADGTLFVWTVEKDSTSHRTPVAIGPTQGNRIVVISGISNGQRIVTEGYQKLSEGTKVAF